MSKTTTNPRAGWCVSHGRKFWAGDIRTYHFNAGSETEATRALCGSSATISEVVNPTLPIFQHACTNCLKKLGKTEKEVR